MIETTIYKGVHQSGTKEYWLYFFQSTGTKNALLVRRWGKAGAEGQAKSETFLGDKANRRFNAALKDRESNGYRMERMRGIEPELQLSITDAIEVVPPRHQSNIYLRDLNTVDPTVRGSGGFYDPLATKREELVENIRQTNEEIAAQAKVADLQEMQTLPTFGMF